MRIALAFLFLMLPSIALANIGVTNTDYLYTQLVIWWSLFFIIISVLVIIFSFLYLRKNKSSKKAKNIIKVFFIIFIISIISYITTSIIKQNIPQTVNQGIGDSIKDIEFREAMGNLPCSQRPAEPDSINCTIDGNCKVIEVPSCPTCQDLVLKCVRK